MMRRLLFAAAVSAACLSLSAGTGWLDPAGIPYTAVVIPADAPGSVRQAARDLVRCIKAAGIADLPVLTDATEPELPAVWVGNTRAARRAGIDPANFDTDEFLWHTNSDGLLIVGDDYAGKPLTFFFHPWGINQMYNSELDIGVFGSAGSMQGVYRFLMYFAGVRWYWPGADGEVVPLQTSLETPTLDERHAPAFEHRYPFFCDFQDSPDDALWFKRLGNGGSAPLAIMHSFPLLVRGQPPESEFFALIDGGRDSLKRLCAVTGSGHLCLTNPQLLQHTVRLIRDYFDADPSHRVFPLVPDDGLGRVCECPACRAEVDYDAPKTGRFSRHVWGFIARVAREVAQTHPGRFIGGLAYEQYLDPPEGVEIPDNVIVQLCQARGKFAGDAYRESVRRSCEQWRDRVKHLYIWEYYLSSNPPWRGFPVLFPEEIAEDLRYLHRIGVKGEMIEAESWFGEAPDIPKQAMMPATQHLDLYLTTQLYWDPELDPQILLDEYCLNFYGPAAEPMRNYWELAQRTCHDGMARALAAGNVDPTSPGQTLPSEVYTAGVMAELHGYLLEAADATPPDSVYTRRIARLREETGIADRLFVRLLRDDAPELELKRSPGLPERLVARDGALMEPPGWFMAKWDAEALHLKVICYEPEMTQLRMRETSPDQATIWDDDCIDIYLAPDPADRSHCFQWLLSAGNCLYDAERTAAYPYGVPAWRSGAATRVIREPNRWIAEVTIPWRAIGIEPGEGVKFAFNLYRVRRAGSGGYSCWSPITGTSHFEPQSFGIITLREE